MLEKSKIIEVINEVKEMLNGVEEPEYSLSFPVIFSKLLEGLAVKTAAIKIQNEGEENFSGLAGGIKLLIKEGFFKEGKSQGEIFEELKRQSYHYPKTSLPITLKGFIQKRILNRLGESGQYRYIERK
jgi:hypothetical protein